MLAALALRWRDRIAYVATDARERQGAGALLVRPDGIVAWAGGGTEDGIAPAAARWFGEPEAPSPGG